VVAPSYGAMSVYSVPASREIQDAIELHFAAVWVYAMASEPEMTL